MWNEPTMIALAWSPLLPLVLVAISLLTHLVIFAWGSVSSNFVHMSNWGAVIGVAVGLAAVIAVTGYFLPPMLPEQIIEYPDEYQWVWGILAGLVIAIVAVGVMLALHHLGRVIYINRRTGKIRFYSVARLVPWSASRHIVDVRPLHYKRGSVDVWGLGTLEPLSHESQVVNGASSSVTHGDISESSIDRLIHCTNAALSRYENNDR